MKRICRSCFPSFLFVFFLLMIQTSVSVASTYYECVDRNGNILITDQSAVPEMTCKPVMQSDDKIPEATRQENKEPEADEKSRTQLINEIESEALNKKYSEKTREIKARYQREIVESHQLCPKDESGNPVSDCQQREQERIQEIQNRMQAELDEADEEYRQASGNRGRQSSEE